MHKAGQNRPICGETWWRRASRTTAKCPRLPQVFSNQVVIVIACGWLKKSLREFQQRSSFGKLLMLVRSRQPRQALQQFRNCYLSRVCGPRDLTGSDRVSTVFKVFHLPSLLLREGSTVSETPLVSTHLDHIQFGCGTSRRCGRTRDTRRIYRGSLCSRIENSR
jgi:hypothetical protein